MSVNSAGVLNGELVRAPYQRLDHGERGTLEDLVLFLHRKKLLPQTQSIVQNRGEVNLQQLRELRRTDVVHICYKSLFPSILDRITNCGKNTYADIDELDILAKFLNEVPCEYRTHPDEKNYLDRLRKVAVAAAKSGKINLITLLLTYRASALLYPLYRNPAQLSLLHLAAAYGQKQVVQLLVKSGMSVNDQCPAACDVLDVALGFWDQLIDPKMNVKQENRLAVAAFLKDRGAVSTTPNQLDSRYTSRASQELMASFFRSPSVRRPAASKDD
jgi:hypothetical protein